MIMEVVNLEIAKKLANRKLIQGQTIKMYQKQNNCSIYELKDNYKNTIASYDAPNIKELIKIAENLRIAIYLYTIKDVNEYATELIKLLKKNKINLNEVRI